MILERKQGESGWLMRLWFKEGKVQRIKGRCSEQIFGYTCVFLSSFTLDWKIHELSFRKLLYR